MKKILVLGMVVTVGLSIAGCSKGSKGNNEVNGNKESASVKVQKLYVYGKVESIAGNEVKLKIAKDPGVDIVGVDKEEEEEEEKDKGKSEAATTTEAATAGESGKVSVGEIDKNKPLVDLEFTEEQKEMLIPAGININVLSEAKGQGISAIKEGSYLRVQVDDNKAANPKILAVDVIS